MIFLKVIQKWAFLPIVSDVSKSLLFVLDFCEYLSVIFLFGYVFESVLLPFMNL